MIRKVEYKDKSPFQNDDSIPNENKVLASDLNEIKETVNNNAIELEETNKNIFNINNSVNDLQEEDIKQNKLISTFKSQVPIRTSKWNKYNIK